MTVVRGPRGEIALAAVPAAVPRWTATRRSNAGAAASSRENVWRRHGQTVAEIAAMAGPLGGRARMRSGHTREHTPSVLAAATPEGSEAFPVPDLSNVLTSRVSVLSPSLSQ